MTDFNFLHTLDIEIKQILNVSIDNIIDLQESHLDEKDRILFFETYMLVNEGIYKVNTILNSVGVVGEDVMTANRRINKYERTIFKDKIKHIKNVRITELEFEVLYNRILNLATEHSKMIRIMNDIEERHRK